jgi:type IV pilus biogenesis protein CpaD/CtpE
MIPARHTVYCALVIALAVIIAGLRVGCAIDKQTTSTAKDSVIANRDLEIRDLKKDRDDWHMIANGERDAKKLDRKRFLWYLGMIGYQRKYTRWEMSVPGQGDVP